LPKVHIEPFQVYGWSGQRLRCGPLSLVLAPAIGGRIISLRFEGKELLFVQKEHAGEIFDFSTVEDLNAQKNTMGFRLWGGDKTWVAPQSEWQSGMPPLELDAGNYQLTWEEGGQAVMTSPVCRETGLRIVRKVRLEEDMSVRVCEEFHNTTDHEIRKGIWNVTQVLRPCNFYIPAAKGSFRSYHSQDPTLPALSGVFTEDEGWVEFNCRQAALFKCGGMPKEGQVLIRVPLGGPKEIIWLKSFEVQNSAAAYAHQSAVEVFNSNTSNYAEIELHAPLAALAPGASCRFEQTWRFKKI
jgi:hypothetical protein